MGASPGVFHAAEGGNPCGSLCLGSERRDEEHRTRASEERATVYQWVLSQAVCESSAMGCGAWCNRVESNQEPSFQAGRESSRVVPMPPERRR